MKHFIYFQISSGSYFLLNPNGYFSTDGSGTIVSRHDRILPSASVHFCQSEHKLRFWNPKFCTSANQPSTLPVARADSVCATNSRFATTPTTWGRFPSNSSQSGSCPTLNPWTRINQQFYPDFRILSILPGQAQTTAASTRRPILKKLSPNQFSVLDLQGPLTNST